MENLEKIQAEQCYIPTSERAIGDDSRFEHVMALALDSESQNREGVIRCIVAREGNVAVSGYIDRSALYSIKAKGSHYEIEEELHFNNENKRIADISQRLGSEEWEYLGNENPDIWRDKKSGELHLYFTMPFRNKQDNTMAIGLGHAVGGDVHSLTMTEPVLMSLPNQKSSGLTGSAKEVSIAPVNAHGVHLNLVESADLRDNIWYSIIRVAEAADMGKQWKLSDVVFHPAENNIPWAGEHASPGPLMPRSFIDVGEGRMLGFMNGREASDRSGDEVHYGKFSVGLFLYNYEQGVIEWVSPEPLIFDSEAKTITFASQFVTAEDGKGMLYAHIDDSFVRSYTINSDVLRQLLPKEIIELAQ